MKKIIKISSHRVTLAVLALIAVVIMIIMGGPVGLVLAGHHSAMALVSRVIDAVLALLVVCVIRMVDHNYPVKR